MRRLQRVASQIARDHAADDIAVHAGLQRLVAAQIGAAQHLIAPLQEQLRADAGYGRRHGAGEDHPGGNTLPDALRHGGVLQAEDLRQDHAVLVLEQQAHLLHDALPVPVEHAGQRHGTDLRGALPYRLRQVEHARPARDPLLLQSFREEGGEEIEVTRDAQDEHLVGETRIRQQADVLQRERRFTEHAQRHQAHAGAVVQADAGALEERLHPLRRLFERLEAAGEEMQGVLPGADDGGAAARLLQADAGHQAGQAAADDHSIESHRPSTCLYTHCVYSASRSVSPQPIG